MGEKQEIKGEESELNLLFKETLDGLRDDLIETDENVQLYLEAIRNDPGGKELYGSLYNDSLKIKGSARDRFLKFLALIKDRVSKKEDLEFKKKENEGDGFGFDHHSSLNEIVQNIKVSKNENIKPDITPLNTEEEEEEEEDYDDDETE